MIKATELKTFLKEKGINVKGLKIRHEWAGTSEAYYVKGDPKVHDLKTIELLLRNKLEYYQRDERSGEILAGGNTWVFVDSYC